MFPLLTATLLSSLTFANEEKPSVFLGHPQDSQNADAVATGLQVTRKKLVQLSHDNKTVLNRYDAFSEVLNLAYHKEKSVTAKEVEQIRTALEFAAEKHRFQTRKNPEKTPYISHPISVAHHLMSVGEVRDAAVVIAALLHDTLEDTQTTFEEIEGLFGKSVAAYVREVTEDSSLAVQARKREEVISAAHKSRGAADIKLADKLCNLTELLTQPPADWSQTRIDRYYEWAQSVIDRLPPESNDKLYDAVTEVINTYWEKQAPSKS